MNKNISKTKIILAIFSLIITFFVWQQGLRDSLNRPSVSFNISQKEKEIEELALNTSSINFPKFISSTDPVEEIKSSLSEVSFKELSERNKLIWIISSDIDDSMVNKNIFKDFKNKNYSLIANELEKKFLDNSYQGNYEIFNLFNGDKFIYHLLSKKFNFDESQSITNTFSQRMFLKILLIKLMPLFTILIGSILVLKTSWNIISLRKICWQETKPLDLRLIDMVLLIAGGFVVLGEVISPLFSISLVQLFSKSLSVELSQSLKIFFGYLFMALPPLLIVYYQIKNIKGEFFFKKDYFQFNVLPFKKAMINGIKGWLMIIPFVLLVSLIMNSVIDNQNGSNPLLEIVLEKIITLLLFFYS